MGEEWVCEEGCQLGVGSGVARELFVLQEAHVDCTRVCVF